MRELNGGAGSIGSQDVVHFCVGLRRPKQLGMVDGIEYVVGTAKV